MDQDEWERFVDRLRSDEQALAATFDHGEFIRVVDGTVEIGFERGSFNARRANEQRDGLSAFLRPAFHGFSRLVIQEVEQVLHCPFKRRSERHEIEMARRHRVITDSKKTSEFPKLTWN